MIPFVKKIEVVESILRSRCGEFELFCLVELKDNPGQWDLVASAAWLPASESEAAGFLIDIVFDFFTPEERETLGRVVVLAPDEPFVNSILETGIVQVSDHVIHGMEISQLHVISPEKRSVNSR